MASRSLPLLQAFLQDLSRSEKRYIRLWLAQHKDPGKGAWEDRFDALCHGSATTTLFGTGRRANRVVEVLRDHIMEAMTAYYRASAPEHRLLQYLAEVDMLLQKEAYAMAQQRLQSAWRLAEGLPWNPYWSRMTQLDAFLARRTLHPKALTARLDALEEALPRQLAVQEKALTLNLLASRLAVWLQRGRRYHVADDRALLDALAANPCLTPHPQDNMECRQRQEEINGAIAFQKADYQKAFFHREALEKMYASHPHRIREAPQRYISILNNWLISAVRLQDDQAIQEGLLRMRGFPARYRLANRENLQAAVFGRSYSIEVFHVLTTLDQVRLEGIIPEIREGLTTYGNRLQPVQRLDFRFLLARSCFTLGRDEEALDELKRVFQPGRESLRHDLQILARILNLLVHFELGNYQWLSTALDGFSRYATKNKHRNTLTKELVSLLRRINHAGKKREREQLVQVALREWPRDKVSSRDRLQWTESGAAAWAQRYGAVLPE